ncbi:hypothetical protein GGR54DRAFT_408896 [Hypoxylon sp. NC1633]|nr:hypothetical protein GGR54DRAFT_408896 [Hypoxylon sp. NC1633]
MKPFSIFALALPWVAPLTDALPQDSGTPSGLSREYTMTNLTWFGNISDGGPEVSFTGPSFSSIESQIRIANPNFTWPVSNDEASIPKKDVQKLVCDPNGVWWAQIFRIKEGIEYLRGKTGQCYLGPGPRVCTRISCSYTSAIAWCNDNDTPIWIDCSLWADYAQDILDGCSVDDAAQRVRGQQFDSGNWNIIVGLDNDHC